MNLEKMLTTQLLIFIAAVVVFFAAETIAAPFTPAQHSAQQDSLRAQPARDEWFAEDKAQHFLVSAFLTGFGFVVFRERLDRSENQSLYFSGAAALSLGLGKELYDLKRPKGRASFKDLVADILGIGITLFLIKTI
jgi:putative lipoprotein